MNHKETGHIKICRIQSQHFLKQFRALKQKLEKEKCVTSFLELQRSMLKHIQWESEFGTNLRFQQWDSHTSWSV